MENKEEEEIILIAGTMNKENTIRFWKTDIKNVKIGRYAIVENLGGYDLVKIVGILKTNKKYTSLISHTKYENMKEVKMEIENYMLEGFKDE